MNSFQPFLDSEQLAIFMNISNWSTLSLFCGNEFVLSERTRFELVLAICYHNIPILYL